MRKFVKIVEYDEFMDAECVDLCNAMNSLPGIVTMESCCGHSSSPYQIFFRVTDSKQGLFFLTRCTDHRYWKYGYLWKIELIVGDSLYEDGELPITYLLTSEPIVGDDAYAQAQDLLDNMIHHLNHDNFMNYYNLDLNKFVWKSDSND